MSTALTVALIVVAVLAAWLAVALLIVVPVGRMIAVRDRQTPLNTTERGHDVGLLALAVLVAVVVALATRGQVVTWDGLVAVPA